MMKKLLLAIALMLPMLTGATDIEAISREWSNMEITVGQKFWDGNTRYEVSGITPDGTFIFAGQTCDTQKGIADAVDVLCLKKTAQPGKYILTQNSSLPSPFRCQWGAEVQYIRQNGMNFLAVKNSKGQIVETLVLTPDGIESLNAQQQQMEQDLLSDFEGMCDAMLMNTHMLVTLDYEVVRVGAMRLAKVKNPDIITKTNAQLLQSEWDYREGKAEGGYDNPDGLGGDGRRADENADNLDQLKHHFKWNGIRPVFDSTEQIADDTPDMFSSEESPMDGGGPAMSFPVKFSGAQPTISDFITAITSQEELCESMNHLVYNWNNRRNGHPITKGATLTLDERNGYCRFEMAYSPEEKSYVEFCYWNCKDGKHKLVAQNTGYDEDGKPIETECTGLFFYLYDNEKRTLTYTSPYDVGASMQVSPVVTYSLPRQGKDIQARIHDSKRIVNILMRWNGQKFDQEKICPSAPSDPNGSKLF